MSPSMARIGQVRTSPQAGYDPRTPALAAPPASKRLWPINALRPALKHCKALSPTHALINLIERCRLCRPLRVGFPVGHNINTIAVRRITHIPQRRPACGRHSLRLRLRLWLRREHSKQHQIYAARANNRAQRHTVVQGDEASFVCHGKGEQVNIGDLVVPQDT